MRNVPGSAQRLTRTAASLAAVVVVGVIDYAANGISVDLDFGPLYLVPIVFAGGWIAMIPGVITALASTITFIAVEELLPNGLVLGLPLIALNGLGRATIYVFVAVLVARLRSSSDVLRDQGEQLQRELRMRQEYVALVAHELRNPLVGIKAAATSLARKQQDAESSERAAGIASEAAAGLKLLDDLSEVSRVESGRLQSGHRPIDLDSVVTTTVAAIGLSDHPVETRGPKTSLQVLGDEQRLAQVVRNLMSNAAKYSPAGSPIEVALGFSADRKMAIVSVRDHGPGVPPAERAQLFQKFRRLSSAGSTRGSGLGLYISREIVRDHGGELSADWPAGGGSTFFFSLPLIAT